MRKLLLVLIIALSASLAFAGGKACCKNKAKGANKAACKTEKVDNAAVGSVESAGTVTTTEGNIQSTSSDNAATPKCATSQKCDHKEKSGWFSFFSKKKSKDCCKNK